MINLDINLDVSSVDIIPPFEEKGQNKIDKDGETFTESPSFMYLDTEADDSDGEDIGSKETKERLKPERNELKANYNQINSNTQSNRSQSSQHNRPMSSKGGNKPVSNTFRIARGFSPTLKENESKFYNYLFCFRILTSRTYLYLHLVIYYTKKICTAN
jgi:hypothetical protein